MSRPSAKADGAAGARRAAALLGIAACAETTVATASEDAAKIDMKLSFRHTFQPTKLLTIHAQIKSGASYRKESSTRDVLTLGIDQATVLALTGTSSPGILVWVPPTPMSRLYWYASDPRRPIKTPVRVGKHQYVRPSISYDLTRLAAYSSWSNSIPRQTVAVLENSKVHRYAKLAYADLKATSWNQPLVGSLHVTRFAWRHVTRRSKSIERRTRSLRIVPYLKAFLSKAPDRFVCDYNEPETNGRITREVRYLRLWYRNALTIGDQIFTVILRIKEEIRYPAN